MRLKSVVLAVAMSWYAQTAFAQASFGSGMSSCGAWVTAHQGEINMERNMLEDWLAGYVSSVTQDSMIPPREFAGLNPLSGMSLFITNYCNQHPLDTVNTAALFLREELIKRHSAQH